MKRLHGFTHVLSAPGWKWFAAWMIVWLGSLVWMYFNGHSPLDIFLLVAASGATALLIMGIIHWGLIKWLWHVSRSLDKQALWFTEQRRDTFKFSKPDDPETWLH